MSDDKPESPKDAARRHMELSRALDEPERRDGCSVAFTCEGGIWECQRADMLAELATLKRERDELKTLVEKNEGRIKAIVDEELLDSNQRLIAENAKLREELLQSQRETNRAADQITSLRRELEELKAEADIRKAQLWVAKDSQLRTYDGLTTRHDRYRTVLEEIANTSCEAHEHVRIAREALENK